MQDVRRDDPGSRRRRRRGRRRGDPKEEEVGLPMASRGGEEEEEAGAAAGALDGSCAAAHVVRVRRELLAECMTCPLCHKLLRDATTISECLHTFCRKCIFEKLMDEEVDSCPICNTDLGCTPLEKLRPDHNLQDVIAKIFPFKRRKLKACEVASSISLPTRRKERSLSSLVVSTPRVATRTGLTRRRTKAVARKAVALRGLNIDGPVNKEEDEAEDQPESSSSPEAVRISQNKRQNPSNSEPSSHGSNKDTENGVEPSADKTELWKPLNCLVEAANRTKSLKFNGQSSVAKTEQINESENELNASPKTRGSRHLLKSKVQDYKNSNAHTTPLPAKTRRVNGVCRKRAVASRELGTSAQALLDAACVKRERSTGPIWFSLIAAPEQEGDAHLPQLSACYLRIKDGGLPVSFIQKYLAKKLDLASETEVEIRCRGQTVVPTLALHKLVDLWLQAGSSQKAQASVGTSAKDFVMVLAYARKAPSTSLHGFSAPSGSQ